MKERSTGSAEAIRGEIRIPYGWTAGDAPGRFLTALRDEAEILGSRCGSCGRVSVPPLEYCGTCFERTVEYVPVSASGTVEGVTEVAGPPPWTLALIRLEGASTALVHRLGDFRPGEPRKGMKVRAVWEEARKGSILDIRHFAPIRLAE